MRYIALFGSGTFAKSSLHQTVWLAGTLKRVVRVVDLAEDWVTRRQIWGSLPWGMSAGVAGFFGAELWADSGKGAFRRFPIGNEGVWGLGIDFERERLLKVELLGGGPGRVFVVL